MVLPPDPADLVAAAVRGVPGVVDLHGGLFGEAATYLPRRRIAGVRVGPQGTDVHISVEYGRRLPDLADQVRRTVEAIPGVTRPVAIEIEDIAEPPGRPERWSQT